MKRFAFFRLSLLSCLAAVLLCISISCDNSVNSAIEGSLSLALTGGVQRVGAVYTFDLFVSRGTDTLRTYRALDAGLQTIRVPVGTGLRVSVVKYDGGVVVESGSTVVNLTAGSVNTVTVNMTVVNIPATGVSLDKSEMLLAAGSADGILLATVAPAGATNKAVLWTSSNTAIATVSTAGVVTPVSAGAATITATTVDGSFAATCEVTVGTISIGVTGVSIDNTTLTLTAGGATGALVPSVMPTGATNKNVTWSSSDASVAAVSSAGVVSPVGAGTATITVTTVDGAFAATCEVSVGTANVAATGVSLDKTTLFLTVGGATGALVPSIVPAGSTNKNVSWSSSNSSVATVSSSGVVNPVAEGSATVTVTTVDGSFSATCEVSVGTATVFVAGVSLDNKTLSLTAGGPTGTLIPTVTPAGATDKNVIWASSNTAVATVSSFGVVNPVSEGHATITVTTIDGSFIDSCELTVGTAIVGVTGVTVDNPTLALTAGGASGTLVPAVAPLGATNRNVTWSSSDASIATVSSSGVVYPVAVGSATITVTTVDGGFTAECIVDVGASVVGVSSIFLDKTSLFIFAGGSAVTLVHTILPGNAANKSVAWSTSNAAVVTVTSSGSVSPVGTGFATVTVTTADGGKAATCFVTVSQPVVGNALDTLVSITGGSFQMGQTGLSEPVHQVTVSSFRIANTEVTQAEYQRVMGSNPSAFTGSGARPVEQVTWFDAVLYCNKRSIAEGKDPVYSYTSFPMMTAGRCTGLSGLVVHFENNGYRLPTEAEWEFACRAGGSGEYYGTVDLIAWHSGNVTDSKSQPVAAKVKNNWGLYDMSGNVWEWCGDWYAAYTSDAQVDPTGPAVSTSSRVTRGGSWYGSATDCRTSYHHGNTINSFTNFIGFRVVARP